MTVSRRQFLFSAAAAGATSWRCGGEAPEAGGVTLIARFGLEDETVSYGIVSGDSVQPVEGDLFGARKPVGDPVPLRSVELLAPVVPTKILALAGNYSDHLAPDAKLPERPEPFYKTTNSIIGPGVSIVLPPDSRDVHYEAEFVIVIGKKAKNVSAAEAPDYILGYTCGNDISERQWQNGSLDGPESKDLQWWRGKGADTFSPVGPVIAIGLDFMKSGIRLRQNGEVKQETTLDHLIFKPAETVAYISKYVTLMPGDLIFTGTTGRTQPIKSGDVLEVEIDGIGVLRNPVV
jgi:2-keto-4-pentenoate hydratase/2-oxohepta-3-ene-1,7-dioic acid hydratase in catechol pathway